MKYYWKFIDQKENYGLQRCLNENHKFTIYCEYKYPEHEDIDREDVIYADSFNDLQIAIQNLNKSVIRQFFVVSHLRSGNNKFIITLT